MLFMASNLTCRHGTFYFRARVPTHLVSAYGRSIVSVSLRTRDPSTAKARARLKRVELERELNALQQDGSTTNALGIAMRFAVAENMVEATSTGYPLTDRGRDFITEVLNDADAFAPARKLLTQIGKDITEGMVDKVAKGWEAA